MRLRDYQKICIDQIREKVRSGSKKALVHLATGAGKTFIFSAITKISSNKNNRVLIVVRRIGIVHQTKNKIEEGYVFMGGKTPPSNAKIIVASIDTLTRRINKPQYSWLKKFNIVIVDEAHDATSDSYKRFFDFMGDKIFIGFTATPYFIGNKGHTFWDCIVAPITKRELIEKGVLCKARVFANQNMTENLDKVKKTGLDYNSASLYEHVDKAKLYGDVVDNFIEKAPNRFAICFCVNIEHSQKMAESFNERGIKSYHCDANTDQQIREQLIREGVRHQAMHKPYVLCNVNVFSTGVDIPSLDACILARPTKSKVLYFQQVGRVMRSYPNKENAIIIDHTDSWRVHGHPYDDPKADLIHKTRRVKKNEPILIGARCLKCQYLNEPGSKICESCGSPIIRILSRKPLQVEKKATLTEFFYSKTKANFDKELKYFQKQLQLGQLMGYDPRYPIRKLSERRRGKEVLQFIMDNFYRPDVKEHFALDYISKQLDGSLARYISYLLNEREKRKRVSKPSDDGDTKGV